MKALVGAFNQEKALVGAFPMIVQPVVEPMDRFTALVDITARPKVRRQVAGRGISANFVSSVQYILSAELKTRKLCVRRVRS